MDSEYLFCNFLQLSAFSFNAPPAKSFTVLSRVAVAGKKAQRDRGASSLCQNTAQKIAPNNSQNDSVVHEFRSPYYPA